MYPYPVEPKHMWGLGAIVVALALVVGTITVVFASGYPGATEIRESPRGTLLSGGESQVGCTGTTGCPGQVKKIEVYKLQPPIPADAMAVVAGSTLTFDYEGEATEGSTYCEFSSLESNAGDGLNCRGRGDRVEIPMNLTPGEYGLAVSITQEDGEGADFYGFHLLVKDGG